MWQAFWAVNAVMVVCISSIDFTILAMVEISVKVVVSRSVNLESTSVVLVSN